MADKLESSVITAELCVSCPLHKKKVSINGTCLRLELPKTIDDSRNVMLPGSATIYLPIQKCTYFTGVEVFNKQVGGIVCDYEVRATRKK